VLAAAYTSRLDVSGLPAPAAHAAHDSVSGAAAVAAQLHDTALRASADTAYIHAMDVVLLVCAAVAVLGAVLAGLLLPARRPQPTTQPELIGVA
jgi:(p)ppGpp synthase/HD superfamily hydrolase